MIYQYRYKKFRTLKAAQNYINTLLIAYTCIDDNSIAIKEAEPGFIVRLRIELPFRHDLCEFGGNLIELCTLNFNDDNTVSVIPHSSEDVQKGKVYPTLHLSPDPDEPLKKLVGVDSESYLYTNAFCFSQHLAEKGFIIDEDSCLKLSKILKPAKYYEYIRERNAADKNKSLFM